MNMIVEECFEKVFKLWVKCIKNGIIDKFLELINNEFCGLFGVSVCINSKGLDYYIVVLIDKFVLEDIYEYLILLGIWVVFECVFLMLNVLVI